MRRGISSFDRWFSSASIQLPAKITADSAWIGPQIEKNPQWRFSFDLTEIKELEETGKRILSKNGKMEDFMKTKHDFVLSSTSLIQKLNQIRKFILHSCGFALIKSLPVNHWARDLSAAVFYGIGLHLGNARPQNAKGHLLGHVTDLGLSGKDPNVRIYQTRERQSFHTDSCDIVGLLCLNQALRGGDSALVSSNAIYNKMLSDCPDLALALFDPLATDRRGELGENQEPFFSIPVFNWHNDLLSTIYQRQYIDSAQRFPNAMRLTDRHIAALNEFDRLADSPDLNFFMRLEPGDIQFVHNHNLLHDRTAFEDHLEVKRHLLRLWLSPVDARSLPPVFSQRYGSIIPGARGGVTTSNKWNIPITPL